MLSITHYARVYLGCYNVNKEQCKVLFRFRWFAYYTPVVLRAASLLHVYNLILAKEMQANILSFISEGTPPFQEVEATFSNTLSVAFYSAKLYLRHMDEPFES